MNLSSKAVIAAQDMLAGESGLKVSVEAIQEIRGELAKEARFQVDTDHWNQKMTERIPSNRNPKISVSLVKLHRGQKEKLAEFTALATLQIELASTHERADSLQGMISDYVDALCDVLNRNQGLWSKGVYYAGGFDVDVAPISKGGLNFVQSATISIEIHLWQE
jgi:hypothetical protein